MSAHPAPARRSWVSALVAQVTDYVLEPPEVAEAEQEPVVELKPHPVVAVVAAAPRSGTTTVARLLAAELAVRAAGAAVVTAAGPSRRAAPPARAAVRLATTLSGTALVQPCGRLCLVRAGGDVAAVVNAARYVAPVVLDVAADGSGARMAEVADRVVVVAPGLAERALLDAVAAVVGGHVLKVVNRPGEAARVEHADIVIPDSRIGARAALIGTRALGALGAAIAALADALEVDP
jgi:hypothetical protein